MFPKNGASLHPIPFNRRPAYWSDEKRPKRKITSTPLELKRRGIHGKINVYYLHGIYRYMKLQALLDEVSPYRTLVDRKESAGLFDRGFSQIAPFHSFAYGNGRDVLSTLIPGDLNSRIETDVSSPFVRFLFFPFAISIFIREIVSTGSESEL